MPVKIITCATVAAILAAGLGGAATAGGLADAIVEREPVVIEQSAERAIPGWVLPAAGLLLLGIVAANSDSGGGGGGEESPPETLNVDVKTGDTQ